MHYIGASYQYQMFLAYPTLGQSETQAHSIFLFYTLYLRSNLSFSFFGGPQYSDTQQFGCSGVEGMVSRRRSEHELAGKTHQFCSQLLAKDQRWWWSKRSGSIEECGRSLRRQLTRTLNASVGASYTSNDNIGALQLLNSTGHTLSGNASVQRQIGQHFNLQVQYLRMHQSYSGIQAISSNPDRNRVSATIAYQFSRPLGR